jgi:hypothetical protein
MLANRSSFLSLLVVVALSGCASRTPVAGDGAASGYDLRIEGADVTLAFTRELSMPEFLRLAQAVTNARYVYDGAQVATAGPVTLLGRIHCQRSDFPAFVDTMLYIHGLCAQARGSGDTQYLEVGPVPKGLGPKG